MTKEQIAAVTAWYRWNEKVSRREWDTHPGLQRGVRGMVFEGYVIRESRGNPILAEIIRNSATKAQYRPLVRLSLPNQLTIGRHRLIRRVVENMGGQHITAPVRVLTNADLVTSSIQVVDSADTKVPFRAQEQLIKGTVRVRFGYTERQAYFLSGFDRNERRLSYFFCELPPGAHPETVAEAYEALKPKSVVMAEAQRRKVLRQGDMFLIQMPRSFRVPSDLIMERAYVHGTNHMASQAARIDGVLYVRGNLWHRPLGRRPDHKTLHLGNRWYLCVKNTVPVTR